MGSELFRVTVPPNVTGFVANAGDSQRSRIVSIAITFSDATDVTIFQNPGAVTLTRTAGGPATIVTIGSGLVITPGAGNANSITLTFQNASLSGVENGSLADGRWRLAIPSASFQSALNDPILRRLLGDVDNNGTVDGGDLGGFGASFGSTGVSPFDFNNDLTVDALDFGEFGNRFGVTL